jgi:hypothetical protein
MVQRFANTLLGGLLAPRPAAGGAGAGAGGDAAGAGQTALVALVALREGAATRQLSNLPEVLSVLRQHLPPGSVVEHYTPGGDFTQDGARFARACLIVGVHGANLGNALFLKPGCALVELGGVDIFSDYYCLARNLGLQYFLSIGEGAHGERSFTANAQELAHIVKSLRLPSSYGGAA